MTNVGGTAADFPAKLLEVEVRFCRQWMLDRQFYLGTFVFPTESEHNSNPSQVPIVSHEICRDVMLGLSTLLPGMLCAGPFAPQLDKLAMHHFYRSILNHVTIASIIHK